MNTGAVADLHLIDDLIERALTEDIGAGDITTDAIIGEDRKAQAVWVAKQSGIVAGLFVAERVFQRLDKDFKWMPNVNEGDRIAGGDVLVEMEGTCRAVLTAERVALNFVQRMSGIATKTAAMVKMLEGYPAKILDTRKTIPGFRFLDKYAVKAGGGSNHRNGLYDMVMIKENHIRAAGSIERALELVHRQAPGIKIEVETTTLGEVEEALQAGADIIMLDNMSTETMRQAVIMINKRAKTEASGNMTIGRLAEVAGTGVDYISVGALTHSAEAFDISQQIKEIK